MPSWQSPLIVTRTAAPATDPITLAEGKAHLRVDIPDENDLITALITAATESAESFTRRQFVTATFKTFRDFFPACPILLPRPPLQSVTAIRYLDETNTQQTVATSVYVVDTDSEPGRIYLDDGQVWPTTLAQIKAVEIEYVAGYGAAAAVPQAIRAAIKLKLGHLHEHREEVVVGEGATELPNAAKTLLWTYRNLEI